MPPLLAHLDFLRSCKADRIPHSGRTFLEHLEGTYALLESWGCDETVCVAGLFHSLYGTNAFTTQCIPLDKRDDIRQRIGAPAEQLAYLFCSCERPGALLEALDTGALTSRHDGTSLVIDPGTLHDLIAVECANLIEQGEGQAFLAQLRHPERKDSLDLTPEIVAAIEAYLGKTTPPLPVARVSGPRTFGKYELRQGTTADLEAILWLARELHVDSRYANLYYQQPKVRQRLDHFLRSNATCCLLVTRDGDIQAFLLGALQDLPFANHLSATVQFLYATHLSRGGMARALLRAFRQWATGKGARELKLEDTFGQDDPRTQKLLGELGLTRIGGIYANWL